jgi:NAD(P)-dependent dehydrogenase (short-subunit alcohol dehydrogenase family)
MTFAAEDLMFRPGLMRDQRILVTGGGTGLGRVMAEACLMLGAEVVICGRRGAVLEQTAAELTAAHGGSVTLSPAIFARPTRSPRWSGAFGRGARPRG